MTKVIVIEEHHDHGIEWIVSSEEKSFVAASKEDAFKAQDLINDLLAA